MADPPSDPPNERTKAPTRRERTPTCHSTHMLFRCHLHGPQCMIRESRMVEWCDTAIYSGDHSSQTWRVYDGVQMSRMAKRKAMDANLWQ